VPSAAGTQTLSATHPATAHIGSRWQSQAQWTLLDTGFGLGNHFQEILQQWRGHAQAPRMLHYVGLLSAHDAAQLTGHFAEPLAARLYGLHPGFHRVLLEDGRVSLTLCVGAVQALLAQLDFRADCVLASAPEPVWDKWTLKALARCCQRGTQVLFGDCLPAPALLQDAGFRWAADAATPPLAAVYDPRWQLRTKRRAGPEHGRTPGRCAVVGAGIAGASVARALALRGWQVDVYDAQPEPAGGAAGLPVGLVVPHHSADDSPRSRMSRAGTRLMLQHASERLTLGQDWQPGGVLELAISESALPDVEAEVRSQSLPHQAPTGWATPAQWAGVPGLWHPHAAWVKPARLVQQWLNHPNIAFHGACRVHTLQRVNAQWQLSHADGQAIGRADVVVFANAHACAELLGRLASAQPAEVGWLPHVLEKLQALQAIPGTLSRGPLPHAVPGGEGSSTFPPFPVNGHGSFVSGVPTALGLQWFAGSTFESDASLHANLAHAHATNLTKLHALLPQVADLLSAQFASDQVQAWQGTRCVSHDRLPLVGPLDAIEQPGLWLCAAMGARGLSFSALCAELLAAWLGGEPLPLEANLAKALSTGRPMRRKAPN